MDAGIVQTFGPGILGACLLIAVVIIKYGPDKPGTTFNHGGDQFVRKDVFDQEITHLTRQLQDVKTSQSHMWTGINDIRAKVNRICGYLEKQFKDPDGA